MKDCFEGLVGLSQLDCECYEIVENHKTSPFGLFVDDLEAIDLELIKNAIGCGQTLEDSFTRLYGSAVNFFETDLQVSIASNYKQKYSPFMGRIGERKYTKPLATSNLVGMKLATNNVDGASIIIKSMLLFFDSAGQINLQIYKNDVKLETEYIIDALQGKTTYQFAQPLNLPIVENGYKNEYYFVYEPGALKPMDNKASCGCAGIENIRSKFLKVQGVKGTDFNNLKIDSTYAYGISLDGVISCSIDDMICDFMVNDVFLRRTAMAIWYKLGQLTIEKLFASREINFDTFTDREYLYTRKKKFESDYKSILSWMGENSTIASSNCFVCNVSTHSKMGKLLI